MKKIKSFLKENSSFGIKDVLTIAIIIILYSIVSFYRLGNIYSPNTFFTTKTKEEVIFEFDGEPKIYNMKYFNGDKQASFKIYASEDNINYKFVIETTSKGVFTWNDVHIRKKTKYIKFEMICDTSFGEIAFLDKNKKLIPYSTINEYVMDESNLVPKQISYMNSTYFDEIYFARTAYEYYQNIDTYEWTHPPLGKIIQAIPIYIANYFSPFLYRFMGNLAGICMILIMYMMGAILFKKREYAILSSIIMVFDTFHFAHTRMGTVDSHLVLFIMISTMMMLLYLKNNKTKYLLASGIFFGLSICVKWTGFYAGLGLAILYFYDLIKNKRKIRKSIINGTAFFVIIPLILYCSCFLLFPKNLYKTNTLSNIIKENKAMYDYHSKLDATHFFSSPWYTWPISYKPVWYHQQDLDNNYEETISGVGNLFIWLAGILGFLYAIYKVIIEKNKQTMYIVIMILSLWLPYIFIGRIMFLYHYFPVLPFLYLIITELLKDIKERLKLKFVTPIFLFCIILFFVTYYPIVSGMPIPKKYAKDLELFDSWYFQN